MRQVRFGQFIKSQPLLVTHSQWHLGRDAVILHSSSIPYQHNQALMKLDINRIDEAYIRAEDTYPLAKLC